MYLSCNESQQIFYEVIEGDWTLPVLVFLHEGLGCRAMWKKFPNQLCERTGCPGLIYDRLGFGLSSSTIADRTIHYMHDSALHELPFVCSRCIPGCPFILIGHSDGGSISLIYGAERFPLLRGIITEAAHVFVENESIQGIRSVDESFRLGEMMGLFKYHGEKTERMFRAWADTWLSDWFQAWNIEYALPSLRCPMLIIQGRDDQYGTHRQVETILSKTSGMAQAVFLDRCGHAPHREMEETVLTVMSEFIERIVSAAQP